MSRGEGIKPLNSLFDKYKTILKPPQASVVKVFCEVVSDVMDIKIPTDRVEYSVAQKTITLKTPSAITSEIKLHQKDIINHLKGRLGEKNAPVTIL